MRGGDGTLYLLGLCEGNHCEQVRYHTSAEPATPHVRASHTLCFSRRPPGSVAVQTHAVSLSDSACLSTEVGERTGQGQWDRRRHAQDQGRGTCGTPPLLHPFRLLRFLSLPTAPPSRLLPSSSLPLCALQQDGFCSWITVSHLHLPSSVDFTDYSAISFNPTTGLVAITSQEDSRLWVRSPSPPIPVHGYDQPAPFLTSSTIGRPPPSLPG